MPVLVGDPKPRFVDVSSLLGWRKARWIAGILVVSLAVGLTLYQKVLPDDFMVYRGAALRLLSEPDDLYQAIDALPYTYPPFAALLFLPLALVPGWVGASLLLASSLLSLAKCCETVTKWLKLGENAWGGVLVLMLVSEPVISTLAYGQLNIILAAMVLTTFTASRPWGGLLLGIAMAIKLTPAIFLVTLLLRRSWGGLAAACVGAAGATVLGLALLPQQSATYWTSTVFDAERVGGAAYSGNQSLSGMLWRLFGPGGSPILWIVLVATVLAGVAYVNVRAVALPVAVLATALGGLLISPVSWTHHWVLAPAVAMMIWRLNAGTWARLLSAAWILALLTWAVWWLPHEANREYATPWGLQPVISGYVVLGAASLVFFMKHARSAIGPEAPGRARENCGWDPGVSAATDLDGCRPTIVALAVKTGTIQQTATS